MSKYGLNIAASGKNVNSSIPTDFVFSTTFQTLPIYQIIRLSYSMPAFDTTRRFIAHGLPFVPFYLMFWKGSDDANKWVWYPSSGANIITSGNQSLILDRIDKTNISFDTNSNSASTTTIDICIIVFAFPITLSL